MPSRVPTFWPPDAESGVSLKAALEVDGASSLSSRSVAAARLEL